MSPSAKGAITAPKARSMIARGKREARRPWLKKRNNCEALKERNNRDRISHFQCSLQLVLLTRGDAPSSTRRPWLKKRNNCEALKERNNRDRISHFQCSLQLVL